MEKTVVINEMTGPESVVKICSAFKGLSGTKICSAEPGMVVVEGTASEADIRACVQDAGFRVAEIL